MLKRTLGGQNRRWLGAYDELGELDLSAGSIMSRLLRTRHLYADTTRFTCDIPRRTCRGDGAATY
ncbi:hypothetical protein KCP78_09270 [Salmonella enterica subsp. enterica]|nr:hypothetical protein KCP78_09270 [Salmonella enterica subsp. enterica]